MNDNLTLAIIKPDSVEKEFIVDILNMINDNGFKIVAIKMRRLTQVSAKNFYYIHTEKPFFNDLIGFMTSGPCVVVVLKKENAVKDFRELIGNTDPSKAKEGTIRKKYGESIERNAIHGSDSNQNATEEINFHFDNKSIFI